MPQIIDKEVFQQAQEMMQKRKKTPGAHKATTTYLLTGLIKCGECGHAFQGNKRKDAYGNDYISYRCGCRKQKRECDNREIKRDYLEKFILQELEKNILNAIMNGIVNNMLKDKLDELEQVKLNLDLKMNELKIENKVEDSVCVTEDQIRSMFSRFKSFVLERNIPECKKFIGDYIKEVIVYRDHIEVVFNVVFSFFDNEISHNIHITTKRKK